jgi:single-stranded-DNA-specific exonuclease
MRTKRPGLRALLRASGGFEGPIDADTLGYLVGPRLNAAGRLEDASLALELLTTQDEARADQLSQQLGMLNRRRQQMVDEALLLTERLAGSAPLDTPVIVLGDPGISRGIVGLIAARLAEVHGRPAFVYEEAADECVGSARGVPGFDVVMALSDSSHLLTRHGGHRAAGGFALPRANLATFKAAIIEAAQRQMATGLPPLNLLIDAESRLGALDQRTLAFLDKFAPCGIGNPPPILMSPNVSVLSGRAVGGGKHLMLDLRDGRSVWRSFAFGRGNDLPNIGKTIDIVYSIEKGRRGYGPRLRLVDWHESKMVGVRP